MYGNQLFGRKPSFWAPVLFLIVFCASALVSALITLGYPVILIWKKNEVTKALKLVAFTAFWLMVFILSGISLVVLR